MADGGSQRRKPDFRTAVADVKALGTVFAMEAESVLGRRTARFLGMLVLVAVLVGILLVLLEWYVAPRGAEQKQALIVTTAQIVGGIALLSGLYFTWRRVEISQHTLEATQDQQVTERFTRAIDQLGATDDKGDKKLEIRLGGIYALERIAWDSLAMENLPGRDYSTVMEVLTAYVRENTPQAPGPSNGSSDAASVDAEATAEANEEAKQPAPPEPRRPTADIQAILDVLSRAQARVPEEHRTRLDLHEASLQGANLEGANLKWSNLQRAYLEYANLRGANLQRAYLEHANLHGANLHGAKVTDEQLADELYLQGATMPDGSKHP